MKHIKKQIRFVCVGIAAIAAMMVTGCEGTLVFPQEETGTVQKGIPPGGKIPINYELSEGDKATAEILYREW